MLTDFSLLAFVCISVGFVIMIAVCVALISIKRRRRNPPLSKVLLDADYRNSVLESFPPVVKDSRHYRCLVKSTNRLGYPDPHCSKSQGTSPHFQLSADGNDSHPFQASDRKLHHVTAQNSTSVQKGLLRTWRKILLIRSFHDAVF